MEYKVKFKKGSVVNTEYWTDEDWRKHNEYVERLKNSNEYLDEEEVLVTVESYEFWDEPESSPPNMSYRFELLNLGK